MKLRNIVASLCLLAGMALAQNFPQNTAVQTIPVLLTAAPVGDCRGQFYQIAYVPSTQATYGCNSTTGVWTAGVGSGTTGTGATVLATSPTITTPTLTAPVVSTITNTGTETLPSSTGGLPIVIACGATTGTAACANTAVGATSKIYFGAATLASNAATITLTPGYTSSSTFFCVANDVTTRANPVQAVPASATTFTITNTTGASDVVQYICTGY